MKARTKRILTAVVAAVAICAALCFNVAAAGTDSNCISSVALSKSGTDISIEVLLKKDYVKGNKSATLYLFELMPYNSIDNLGALTPVKEFKPAEKSSIKLPYFNGNGNRLFSSFAVAEKLSDGSYSAITPVRYIDNIDVLCRNQQPYPSTSSKKGLQVQMLYDAQQLGVNHTVISVNLNDYIVGENTQDSISCLYNGQSYYFSKSLLNRLDYTVRSYSDAGINVYLNIYLAAAPENANAVKRSFYFENANPEATLFAVNTGNETAVKNYQAFIEHLISRYTDPQRPAGFAPNIILGYNVNEGETFNSGGEMYFESYVENYAKLLRMTQAAMDSHYSNGRVYVSVSNAFNYEDPEKKMNFSAKRFIEALSENLKKSGDIPWGIAINPNPSVEGVTEFWNDDMAEDNFSTPYITMKNIGVLTRFMNQSDYQYNSQCRNIIISSFAISGRADNEQEMTMQAAAYALAYYTVADNEDIDAFIYHRHVDHSGEGYSYGLWSAAEGAVLQPQAKKPIYNVFSLIDTERGKEATSFVKTTVGNGIFGMFMSEKAKYDKYNTRTIIEDIRADEKEYAKGYSKEILFDLTEGSLCGFYPSDGDGYVELRQLEGSDKVMLYSVSNGRNGEYVGISNRFTEDSVLDKTSYISLRMMVTAPEDQQSVTVVLRLQDDYTDSKKSVVYEGEVQLKPGEWQDVAFKVKDFAALTSSDLDLMKIWIKAAEGSGVGEYGVWLERVTLYNKKGVTVIGVVLWVLLAVVLLAVAGIGVLYLRAWYIRRRRRAEKLRRMRERQQAEAMNRRRMNPPPYSGNIRTNNGQQNVRPYDRGTGNRNGGNGR